MYFKHFWVAGSLFNTMHFDQLTNWSCSLTINMAQHAMFMWPDNEQAYTHLRLGRASWDFPLDTLPRFLDDMFQARYARLNPNCSGNVSVHWGLELNPLTHLQHTSEVSCPHAQLSLPFSAMFVIFVWAREWKQDEINCGPCNHWVVNTWQCDNTGRICSS